jgi:cyclic pyranopterin phosphate synthase
MMISHRQLKNHRASQLLAQSNINFNKLQNLESEPIPVDASLDRILRIVVTTECNWNCFYCHREGMTPTTKNILTTTDIIFFVKTVAELFDGVAIVGGEPLLHRDLLKVAEAAVLSMGCPVHLTTNASISMSDIISNASLFNRINVSLNVLDPNKHQRLCGTPLPSIVYENASRLAQLPCDVHVNAVAIPGYNTNEEEILALSSFCDRHGFRMEFLHLMPRSRDEVRLLTAGLGQFRSVMKKLGFTASIRHRPYSHPNTLYRYNEREIVLRDYGQVIDPKRCSNCMAQTFCTEGLSHIRLLPNGSIIACRYGSRFRINLFAHIRRRRVKAILAGVKNLQRSFREPLFWHQLPGDGESEDI